jgi:hypothetical protein
VSDVDNKGATVLFHASGVLFTHNICDGVNQYAPMLCLLSEYGADINHVYDEGGSLGTIWNYLECEVFGKYHAALTPLGDAPPRASSPGSLRNTPSSCKRAICFVRGCLLTSRIDRSFFSPTARCLLCCSPSSLPMPLPIGKIPGPPGCARNARVQ